MHQCPCCAAAVPDSSRLCWLTAVSTQIAREAGLVCTPDIEDITTVAYAGLLDSPTTEELTQAPTAPGVSTRANHLGMGTRHRRPTTPARPTAAKTLTQ